MGDRLRNGGDRALNGRMLSGVDRERFIRAETRLAPVPFVPEISIHQADEATSLWEKTEAELATIGLPPPFWAFAWAGGRGLARYVLDHPEIVAGKRVVDFASGSGLVAIAAARAGAASVEAVDIDSFAAVAIGLNASANGVTIVTGGGDRIGSPADTDIVLAGDIFYDRAFSERVLPWLTSLARHARVIVGDPGRTYRPAEGFKELARYEVPAETALEDSLVKQVSILEILPCRADAGTSAAASCDSASR